MLGVCRSTDLHKTPIAMSPVLCWTVHLTYLALGHQEVFSISLSHLHGGRRLDGRSGAGLDIVEGRAAAHMEAFCRL